MRKSSETDALIDALTELSNQDMLEVLQAVFAAPPRPAADGAQHHAQASHRDPGGNHKLAGHTRRP